MSGSSTFLCGVGMFTPVGTTAAESAAAVRAGISRYVESDVMNSRFQPMTLCLLPDEVIEPLEASLEGKNFTARLRRLVCLASPALREAMANVTSQLTSDVTTPLFLAGPEPYPGQPEPADASLLDHIAVQSGVEFERSRSAYFGSGRAGGIRAIEAAMEHLQAGGETALVGGVDSYLDLHLLALLDAEGRVLADGVMDSFAPGEGAAFLLLASRSACDLHGLTPIAELREPALALEPGHRYSEEYYLGTGLAAAVTSSLSGFGETVQSVFVSFNGESFSAKEWSVAAVRNAEFLAEDLQMEHPADCVGDLGAAIGPLLVGLAAIGMYNGFVPAPSLVWCSSDGSPRGAVCVAAVESTPERG